MRRNDYEPSRSYKLSEADRERVKKAVRRFSEKRKKVQRERPEIARYQPEVPTTREIIADLKGKTQEALEYKLAALSRYLEDGAEDIYMTESGVITTNYQMEEIRRGIEQANKERDKLRARNRASTYTGTMGTLRDNALKPRKNRAEVIGQKHWQEYASSVERLALGRSDEERERLYKRNFLRAIESVFGEEGGVTAKKLYRRISKTPLMLYQDYYDIDPILTIGFVYNPAEAKYNVESMLEHLDEAEMAEGYYSGKDLGRRLVEKYNAAAGPNQRAKALSFIEESLAAYNDPELNEYVRSKIGE